MVNKILITLLLLLPISSFGAEFTASARNKISAGESINLQLELSGASAESQPDISILNKLFTITGRQKSSNISIINGKMTSATSWHYSMTPKVNSNIVIPAISIKTDKGILTTKPINIEVGKVSSLPATSQNNGIVAYAEVSKSNPYKNEPITYTFNLVSKYSIANVDINDITLENAILEPQGKPEVFDANQGGEPVKVVQAKFLITPLKSGKITIPANIVKGDIITRSRNRIDSFFGDPFDMFNSFSGFSGFGAGSSQPFTLASKPINLNVLPPVTGVKPWLPASSIKIEENIDNNQTFKVGEPIIRSFNIVAEGVASSQLPSLEEQQNIVNNFKVYADQPKVHDNIINGVITSSKTESFTLIPQVSGDITLPEISITWWNVNENKIEHAIVPARSLTVLGGANIVNKQPVTVNNPIVSSVIKQPQYPKGLKKVPQINKNNNILYIVIAILIVILIAVILLVIKLNYKINNPQTVIKKTTNNPVKVNKNTAIKDIKNIKTAKELQQYLQFIATNQWGLNRNLSLDKIIEYVNKQKPDLTESNNYLLKSIQDSLYANKEIDIIDAQKRCIAIVNYMDKKTINKTKTNKDLPSLNPS